LDCCKEAIAKFFNDVENEYMEIWEVIDEIWKMLHSSLHATTSYSDAYYATLKRVVEERISIRVFICNTQWENFCLSK
jgi:hypothetical protein